MSLLVIGKMFLPHLAIFLGSGGDVVGYLF